MKIRRRRRNLFPKVRRKIRRRLMLIGLGIAVLIGGIALALSLHKPQPSLADPQAEWQARQAQVSQVIQSSSREALVSGSPTLGNKEAQLILFEFSDFQCPYCARAVLDVKAFMEKHDKEVLFVYKYFPLTQIHPEAVASARAAWAAAQQGKFWIYHDGLFANQARLGDELYLELAEQIGLDREAFERDRKSPASLTAVQRDLQLAQAMNLGGTPTFLINDLLLPPGASASVLEDTLSQIQAALKNQENQKNPTPSQPSASP